MPTPSKKPTTILKPVAGTIVWVRRRNGSWWPGRIISKKELLASNVMSPRSGTPVKLLGRDDASVDWYNIEKSKRVKAFRCGEFDDCIEKAQAMVAGSQSKRREKYARREDAIVDAIELEKEQMEIEEEEPEVKTKPPPAGKKSSSSRQKGKQNGEQAKKGGRAAKKGGGQAKKSGQGGGGGAGDKEKEKEKERDQEAAQAPASQSQAPPRMRGLQDLVSAGTSSKISSIEGLEGCSEEVDEKQGKPSMKRKRSAAAAGSNRAEEPPLPASKRRDRKRAIAQVLETTKENRGEEEEEQAGSEKGTKAEVCNGDDKLSEGESTQETVVTNPVAAAADVPAAKPEKDSQVLDAHSVSSGALAPPPSSGDGAALPSLASSPSAALPQEKAQEKAVERPQIKRVMNRRKKVLPPPRTLASRIETTEATGAGAAPKEAKEEKPPEPAEQQAAPAEQKPKPSVSRVEPSTASEKEKGENEETVTACSPSPKSEEQQQQQHKETSTPTPTPTPREGFTGPCHPRTRFEKQPVPAVPLYSSVLGTSVNGHPVPVEVVKSIGPLWQRRTRLRGAPAGYEVPESYSYEEEYYGMKVPGTGKAPKKSKETLSKKLLKRAVLTSKKIRTLASISEERRRQPFTELLSSELPPRWPVATLVPVSVALNRLRTIVCS